MESDQFMPEYWPANRIIGKLEKALVKAENILGLIQSEQIANLAAAKVTGLLTSAQIAEIEAAKIGGQLTNAQIKEIEAAKITGQISNSQLAANSVTAEKIAALQVTAGKIAAEAVTAEKIGAGQIITAKLAAGAVTAEKMTVASLSAISANLGTITAGTLKAVVIEGGTGSFEGELKATSLTIPSGVGVTPATKSIIRWLDPETGESNAFIYGNKNSSQKEFIAGPRASTTAGARLTLTDQRPTNNKINASIGTLNGVISIEDSTAGHTFVTTQVNAITKLLLSDAEESDFLFRKAGTGTKGRFAVGTTNLTFPSSAQATPVVVTHGLGFAPIIVLPTVKENGTGTIITNAGNYTATQFTLYAFYVLNTAITNTITVPWIAIV